MLNIDRDSCVLCNQCVEVCPFHALKNVEDHLIVQDTCTLCGLCINHCAYGALCIPSEPINSIVKSQWKGILVYVEHSEGNIHPITYELIGIASELAKPIGYPVYCLFIGQGITKAAEELSHYEISKVFVYDDVAFMDYREDIYTNAFEDCVKEVKPSVVLVGGTDVGKSLAPTVATRFHTGLTADCTELYLRENSDLVQIRPAFGGNVMAQIATANHRPQFATVRYKIMSESHRTQRSNDPIVHRSLNQDQLNSKIEIIKKERIKQKDSIAEEKVLVVAGQGFKCQADLWMAEEVARLLHGKVASTRALVEKGWMPPEKQIGLSGNSVSPEVILTCGVSGSIQFMTGMRASKTIIAINSDMNAPILSIAHLPICGDIYTIVPKLINRLTELSKNETVVLSSTTIHNLKK